MNLLLSRLDEQQRRWYVALEAKMLGHGGATRLAQITGMHVDTIHRGRAELDRELADRPVDRVRLPGGGRPPVGKKTPGIEQALESLVEGETAGDPMSDRKWVRSSLRHLSRALAKKGYQVGRMTVRRLLRQAGYSLQANRKQDDGAPHPDRNRQFRYIERVKKLFCAQGHPVISVDAKKKELIGNFKNAGRVWCQHGAVVNVHDFPDDAVGRAVPYGIYDLQHDQGYVYVGTSADTSEFAVEAICRWWRDPDRPTFPDESKLLILADAGGSDGCRFRLWKRQLQAQLADRLGIEVMVCHYPTGASKWNPIEHRLFSHISLNWAGQPLRSFETMLGYIQGTMTTTGLQVRAFLVDQVYEKGIKVADQEMQALNLHRRRICPTWNYVIKPRVASP
ncbi:MAG: ISAzo13 family transposase [Chloroflexi bacterium]|nr:ISAzo13 family transposase [Chloroflexota bacterium]